MWRRASITLGNRSILASTRLSWVIPLTSTVMYILAMFFWTSWLTAMMLMSSAPMMLEISLNSLARSKAVMRSVAGTVWTRVPQPTSISLSVSSRRRMLGQSRRCMVTPRPRVT